VGWQTIVPSVDGVHLLIAICAAELVEKINAWATTQPKAMPGAIVLSMWRPPDERAKQDKIIHSPIVGFCSGKKMAPV
jgi:hypothetical protein